MKKFLFFAAATVVALSSCSKTEEVGAPAQDAVVFGSFMDRTTKATETTLTNLGSFNVDAYYTAEKAWVGREQAGVFMNGLAVSSKDDGETWGYTAPIYYWPNKVVDDTYGKVSFFAYAPTTGVVKVAATASANYGLTFTTAAAAASQVDLVAAGTLNQDKTTNAGEVDLAFNHLLSQINFSAARTAEYADATITVTGISVNYVDAVAVGTYTFDNAAATTVDGWAETSDFAAGVAYTETGLTTLIPSTAVGTAKAISLNATGNALMLIPQALPEGGISVTINYTLKNSGEALVMSNVATIDLPATTLDMGKKYTFNFNISLTGVTFDAVSVADWVAGSTQPTEQTIE